ncbi:hypothetical protein BTK96_000757 [Burkholderia pyrrocinia]|uniref:hypothetical protein n=1 Tax=Burkholderia sp. IT-111MI5 TaxID=3026439 RepID=UPI002A307527|nr:hypothetical protein [Burkholderia pyrrocinia]EKS9893528.1 hypothetical protein [Burkholderia pyrrocinia]
MGFTNRNGLAEAVAERADGSDPPDSGAVAPRAIFAEKRHAAARADEVATKCRPRFVASLYEGRKPIVMTGRQPVAMLVQSCRQNREYPVYFFILFLS